MDDPGGASIVRCGGIAWAFLGISAWFVVLLVGATATFARGVIVVQRARS
jgi:hypothetical protein